jgi:polysaccharide chain length determinant protein (PEP-CTERM system associated)
MGQQRPKFHPLSIAKMLWKHKLQVLLVWVVLSGITAAVVYRIPATYEAKAVILVDSQKIPDKYVTSTVSTDVEDRIASLRQEILGPTQLLKIINQFNLYKDQRNNTPEEEIIEKMTRDTKVTLERGWTRDRPGAFEVSYEGTDPRVVARVANTIMDLFIQTNETDRNNHAAGTTEFMTDRLELAKKSLNEQEDRLAKYKLAHNDELPEQQTSLGATLSRLQLELQGNEDAINRAQQNKIMVENSIGAAESSVGSLVGMLEQSSAGVGASAGQTAPAWGNAAAGRPVQKESDALEAKLDLMRVRYGDDHPEIKRLRAEIAQLREIESKTAAAQAQAERRTKSGTAPSPGVGSNSTAARSAPGTLADQLIKERERLVSLKAQLAQTNQELEFRNNERQGIISSIKQYETRLEHLPRREQEMEGLTRDYQISKDNYRSLLDKKLAAEMASEMEKQQKAEKFTPLEVARIPEVPVKPKRPVLIGAGCLVSLLIGLAVAAGRELKRGTLLGEWELPPGVNVMGRVPWIQINPDGTLSQGGQAAQWWRRGWPLALVSSVLVFACGIAAMYLGWVRF